MKRSFEDYLNDIMEAITAIEAFTKGMTKENFITSARRESAGPAGGGIYLKEPWRDEHRHDYSRYTLKNYKQVWGDPERFPHIRNFNFREEI
ncbi:MAG: hypothetical protein QHH75_12180 [Bacillota bacterium]|nr:hypothetical protein [Bacillota bacterium]